MEKYEIGEHVKFCFNRNVIDGFRLEEPIVLHCTIVGEHKEERHTYLLQIDDANHPREVDEWIQSLSVAEYLCAQEIERTKCFASHRSFFEHDMEYYDNLAASQSSIDVMSVL